MKGSLLNRFEQIKVYRLKSYDAKQDEEGADLTFEVNQ